MSDKEDIKNMLETFFEQRKKIPLMNRVWEVLSANDEILTTGGVENKILGLKNIGKRFDKYKIGTIVNRWSQSENWEKKDFEI